MNYIFAAVLGVVQGITEFLPISSTGHLILTSNLLHLPATEFWKSFEIAIQLGSILAVVVLYVKKYITKVPVIKKIITAFLPTAVLGLAFYKLIKQFLLGNSTVVLWSLLIGGAVLIIFELLYKEKLTATEDISAISYKQCLLIGLCQSLAMVPGVSRSAATVVGGLALGLKRKTIVEFSFLLAVPTMLAATGLDLLKSAGSFKAGDFGVLGVGFVVSFIVALFSIKFLLEFIKKHTFLPFGVYRVVVAILFWLVIL